MNAIQIVGQLQSDRQFCDVFLQGEAEDAAAGPAGGGVRAHRVLLAAASPYFFNLFTDSPDGELSRYTVKGVEPAALQAIVDYIYRPESLVVTADNAQALLAAASLLEVDGVHEVVYAFLERALTARDAFEPHACSVLAADAAHFVRNRFASQLELLEPSADKLAALLNSLTVSVEEHVLDAVLQWAEHVPKKRRRHLAELLQRVRLSAVPMEALAERARAEPLASADLTVKDIIIRALSFHCQRTDPRAQDAAASAWYRPRQTRVSSALLVVGGETKAWAGSTEVLHCELSAGLWQSAPALPAPRCVAGVATLGGLVYVVGGHDGRSPQSTVLVLDVATGSWIAGPALRTTRYMLGVAALDGVVYAAGGRGAVGGVLRRASLDPREGVWRSIADMSSRRAAVAVAALGGVVYAAGGTGDDRQHILYTVERYDPAAGRWRQAESMAGRRTDASAGVVDDELYVVGGRNESTALWSVERYRAGAGWQRAPDMSEARRGPALATHAGRLYVAGGLGIDASFLSSVAVYEPATGAWSELPAAMPAGLHSAAAVVVDWPSETL